MHKGVFGFSVEAYAKKKNRGPCVYYTDISTGVMKCSTYVIGDCDDNKIIKQ